MIGVLIQAATAVMILMLLQWKTLKKGDTITRWLSHSLVVLAGALYFYMQTEVHVPHPSVWLDAMLRPWSPV